ncbi:hypothetical protein NA56DRAFT_710605 [Hyaloscypha hepaticicola]|uniref:Uncharacterized protein n=1 Tax=Hyaloscypha hepaticicola TaxID=2082293 RepID=A0A2J6PKZ8_9HELO|nr:hypothetical protein NA56DRAFT_710605 [Hyaloscypha hepaticicola]
MDFLKKAQGMMGENSGNNQAAQQAGATGEQAQMGGQGQMGAQGQAMGNNQNEDYGDKGLDFIQKKTGHTLGRDTNEKITDGARGLFEKATGKKVDPKWSN